MRRKCSLNEVRRDATDAALLLGATQPVHCVVRRGGRRRQRLGYGRASGSQNRPADDPEGRGTKFCEEGSVILCFTYFGHFVNALHRLLQHHTHKDGMGEFFATLNNRVNKLVEHTNKIDLIL